MPDQDTSLDSFMDYIRTFNPYIVADDLSEDHAASILHSITTNFSLLSSRDKLKFFFKIIHNCSSCKSNSANGFSPVTDGFVERRKSIPSISAVEPVKELNCEYDSIEIENKKELLRMRYWLIKLGALITLAIILLVIAGIIAFSKDNKSELVSSLVESTGTFFEIVLEMIKG